MEKPKSENYKVSVNFARSFQLRKSQIVSGEQMGVGAKVVQPIVTTSVSKSQTMGERSSMSEMPGYKKWWKPPLKAR